MRRDRQVEQAWAAPVPWRRIGWPQPGQEPISHTGHPYCSAASWRSVPLMGRPDAWLGMGRWQLDEGSQPAVVGPAASGAAIIAYRALLAEAAPCLQLLLVEGEFLAGGRFFADGGWLVADDAEPALAVLGGDPHTGCLPRVRGQRDLERNERAVGAGHHEFVHLGVALHRQAQGGEFPDGVECAAAVHACCLLRALAFSACRALPLLQVTDATADQHP